MYEKKSKCYPLNVDFYFMFIPKHVLHISYNVIEYFHIYISYFI